MGKIRIKTFDESSPEDEAKLKAKKEAKKAQKKALKDTPAVKEAVEEVVTPEETVETPEDITTTEDVKTIDETVKTSESAQQNADSDNTGSVKKEKKAKKEKFAKQAQKIESKRHKENLSIVSKTQTYTLTQALEALMKFKKSKFDETVELHINTKEKGISGQVTLPHGTGKTLKIKIADETILAEVAKGKIDFDVLVATPSMMPNLAKVARILGPRGLMPNPKNGTITDKPEDAVKKLSGGQINYKTESDAKIIHAIVGKVSFEENKLTENINTFLDSVGKPNIVNVTLKSTMSPGIRIVL